ncbi:mCG147161 [Mus musculus]|nr:mCG147161 [Mus musculus]
MLCQCLVMHNLGHPQGSVVSHSPTKIMQGPWYAWPRRESFTKIDKRRTRLVKGNPART